jgi:exodeoxyribonuclease V alpha subunit
METDFTFDASQLRAIEMALDPRVPFVCITGGAGTGKTTIIKRIMDELKGQADMMAPTGKAAARLRDATGYEAGTIHRWLALTPASNKPMRPGRATRAIVIDESSMVDSWLLALVLSYHPPKLILVGDAAQLPPVGAGSPFHDALRLRPELVCWLTTCHRSKAAVHEAALMIREGQMPDVKMKGGGETFQRLNTGSAEKTQVEIGKLVAMGHFDPRRDAILTPHNGKTAKDHSTRTALNDLLVSLLNPRFEGVKWAIGDRIMNSKNNSELDWWNGETGEIEDIDQGGNLHVRTDRGQSLFLDNECQKWLDLAYALTVHKSQGSQYRRVFVVILWEHLQMLDRSLIYTAITRAKEGCYVLGSARALQVGLGKQEHKRTVLQHLGGLTA